ncbi:hypothetical protein MJO28_013618 [Puccinia striiformis f. sp. tritici]|uniref:Uncharacterized protein n=1 Tax=Puccinia striiformis f. sp. tritici TaxID=168172 RepID=A0ACC0DV29_9BASI|nr:hypothetical protein MJO28_013618 [Puccinia striiformis f. sp. tritici]
MILCNTSFKLFYPKKSPSGKSWKPLNHLEKLAIELNVGSTTFADFHRLIADACNEKVKKAGVLIMNALASRATKLAWHVWHVPAIAEEFMKKNNYQIKDKESYRHWMDTIVELGKDRIHAICYEWAHAMSRKVDGVGWFNPLAKFKMLKLSSKKRKTSDTTGPPIVPNFDLISEYVEFVNINPAQQEKVLKALADNEIDHPKLFDSKSITADCMRRWGLANGTIAYFKDNVTQYLDHLGSK